MFEKIERPSSTAATIVAKLSSASTISAACFETSVPVMSHRDADVGGLQRRRVVDAVAGHRHDCAPRAAAPGRSAACAPGSRARRRTPSLTVRSSASSRHASGARAPVTARASVGDAELLGDDRGGLRMIAGDHDRADAGALRASHGLRRLVPWRIDHADQSGEDEVALDALADAVRRRACRPCERADRRHRACAAPARPARRSRRRISRRRCPSAAAAPRRPARACIARAARPAHPSRRRARARRVGVRMHGAHHLALGRERDLADARRTVARAPASRPAFRAATISAPSVGSP